MSFVLGLDNAVTNVVSPNLAYEEEVQRLDPDTNTEGVRSLPTAQQIPMLDTSWNSRFTKAPEQTKRHSVSQNIERRIPGDRVSMGLPIAASVDWQFAQVRLGPSKTWERAGQGRVAYTEFALKWIIVPGSLVQFREQLPGREDMWYEVVAIRPHKPVLAGTPGTIEFDLKEVLHTSEADE